MYLSVVCTNTRFDVQIQIWITNNIQKNSSIVIVKLLYIHDLVFLIDYSFTVERFVHNLHEDTSYPMYTYCDRSFRKNYECIYLSFLPFTTLFLKIFVSFIHTTYICTFKLLPENSLFELIQI